MSRFKYFGLGVGLCTLGVGCYGIYYQRQQYLMAQQQNEIAREQNRIAQEQNEIARKQNREFKKQNDLEEVSQGLMTKETYQKKWPLKS